MEAAAPSEKAHQKSGYLLKTSSAGIYRKRFFEINGEYLTYFKTEKRRKLLEAISIPGAVNIRLVDCYSNNSNMLSPTIGSRTILIDTRDRQYELLAESVEDAMLWLKEFLSIRDTVLITSHLERSIRQNWAFTSSGKATRKYLGEAPCLEREMERHSEMSSALVTSDNDREGSCSTTEEVTHRPSKEQSRSRKYDYYDCCSCIPVHI